MFNETQDATNIINQMDDKGAPSMSLGGGGSIIDLNPEKEIEEPDYLWTMTEETRQLEEAAKKRTRTNTKNSWRL